MATTNGVRVGESWGDLKCEHCGVSTLDDTDVIIVFDDDGTALCQDCYFEQECEK